MTKTRLAVAAALALSLPSFAQNAGAPAAPSPAPAAAASTFQSDVVGVLGHVQEELVSLEKAVPQSKFNWRPAKGVRSVAEVYLHAAGSGYFFAKFLGAEPPAEAKVKDFEKQTTDRAKIEKLLNDSFAFMAKTVKELPDAELGKTVDFFGQSMTKRAVILVALGHYQEHLGQSIAYARSNGIVPPWSKKAD